MTLLLSFLLAVLVALLLLILRESTRARRRRTWWNTYRTAERQLRSGDRVTRDGGVLLLGELSRTAVTAEDVRMVEVLAEVYSADCAAHASRAFRTPADPTAR
jgi:predicted kinase